MPYERSEENRALTDRARRSRVRGQVREAGEGVRVSREELPGAREIALFPSYDPTTLPLFVSETP